MSESDGYPAFYYSHGSFFDHNFDTDGAKIQFISHEEYIVFNIDKKNVNKF